MKPSLGIIVPFLINISGQLKPFRITRNIFNHSQLYSEMTAVEFTFFLSKDINEMNQLGKGELSGKNHKQ